MKAKISSSARTVACRRIAPGRKETGLLECAWEPSATKGALNAVALASHSGLMTNETGHEVLPRFTQLPLPCEPLISIGVAALQVTVPVKSTVPPERLAVGSISSRRSSGGRST